MENKKINLKILSPDIPRGLDELSLCNEYIEAETSFDNSIICNEIIENQIADHVSLVR